MRMMGSEKEALNEWAKERNKKLAEMKGMKKKMRREKGRNCLKNRRWNEWKTGKSQIWTEKREFLVTMKKEETQSWRRNRAQVYIHPTIRSTPDPKILLGRIMNPLEMLMRDEPSFLSSEVSFMQKRKIVPSLGHVLLLITTTATTTTTKQASIDVDK